jgi:hypothetical protein
MWKIPGECTAVETMSTRPDEPCDFLCAMMGQIALAVLAPVLIFESAGRLDSEDN